MTHKKLRLLFITWSFSKGGGAERILSNLICEISKTSLYDISLLEISHDNIAWEPLPENVTVLPPVLDETNQHPFYRLKRFRWRKALEAKPEWLRDKVRKDKRYDVVVGFNCLYPTFMIYEDEPSISWNHGTIYDLRESPRRLELQRKAYASIDIIVAIAQRTRNSIVELYPEYAHKLRIVPNGFRFDAMREKAEAECEALQGSPVLAIGRLDENKNPLGILEAFGSIHARHPDAHLYFIGSGELQEQTERAATDRNLAPFVRFLGYRENPYPLIRQGSCILTMSHSEGFQSVIAEGLAFGVPFIASPAGSARELSCNEKFGKVVEAPADAGRAYDELLAASQNESWRRDMQEFAQSYSVEQQAARFKALIEELTGDRNE